MTKQLKLTNIKDAKGNLIKEGDIVQRLKISGHPYVKLKVCSFKDDKCNLNDKHRYIVMTNIHDFDFRNRVNLDNIDSMGIEEISKLNKKGE